MREGGEESYDAAQLAVRVREIDCKRQRTHGTLLPARFLPTSTMLPARFVPAITTCINTTGIRDAILHILALGWVFFFFFSFT